jgi:putative ABC transport system substrate-binding protein
VAKNTPIVATAITDFVAAKLVKSDDAPGGNVTGVSDLGPIEAQLDLLLKFIPNAKVVGTIYNSSEINSAYQVEIFKQAAAKRGVEVLEATVSNVNDIQQAVASISSKVAGLWLPTDNVLASAIPALVKVTNPVKLPVVAGERGMTEAGCLGSISVDYYEIGRMTGQMGADILEGKKKPAEMPVQHVATGTPVFNLKAAEAIGVTIPEELKKGAVLFQ